MISELLALSADDPDSDICLFVNSPGGSVTAGLAIYDTMQYIRPPVSTLCIGQASSMGAVLLAAGAEGKRYCLPHARIMIHQPLGGAGGQATDIEIQATEILYLKDRMSQILSYHTGRDIEQIKKDIDRDNFMSAEVAKEYGIIDDVIASIPRKNKEEDK